MAYIAITGADRPTGCPGGGGGVKTFTCKHTHTPLEHCPRDVIRPPEN